MTSHDFIRERLDKIEWLAAKGAEQFKGETLLFLLIDQERRAALDLLDNAPHVVTNAATHGNLRAVPDPAPRGDADA